MACLTAHAPKHLESKQPILRNPKLLYVVLSTVAGLFYGYAFWKTDRIQSSILVHFSVNLVHFLFFSYPALGR
jgi:membrane protease YdiL (CAAX protease family)